jgi:hypothetical protein
MVTPAPSEPEKLEPATSSERAPAPAADANVPHDVEQLGFALAWARKQALACHQGGRAGGTVQVTITFLPEGKVRDVRLSGEPIASAPVAVCISSYFKSMLIPSYTGQPFTVEAELTLR